MTAAELARLGEELGLDAVGAAPAGPYEETERHIRERRARGLFADMRFTMSRPEVSCHPETLLPGAHTVVSAALCTYAPGPEPGPGEGRLPRWTQAPAPVPEPYCAELGATVYGCDICQDACPWNRGIEKRRARSAPPPGAEPVVSLVEWLEAGGAELTARYDRLYVPKHDPRYLRRNALLALGNTGGPEHRSLLERYADDPDTLLREHAAWALRRLDERSGAEAAA